MIKGASLTLITAPSLIATHVQFLNPEPVYCDTLGLSCVTCTSHDMQMRILQVLPDAPARQPFLRLLSTLALLPDCHGLSPSPDGSLLCCSNGAEGLILYDTQTAAEVRWYSLQTERVCGLTWREQDLNLLVRCPSSGLRIVKAARWVM